MLLIGILLYAIPVFALDTDLDSNDALDKAYGGTNSPGSGIVTSVYFPAGSLSADGTQCAAPAEVTINSGPMQYTIVCTDNDTSTIYGSVVLPDGFDITKDITFELSYIQTAADTGPLNSDIAIQCRGTGEAVNNTWGSEIAIDDAAVTGSNAVDMTTSAAVDTADCVAGDILYFRWQMDATGTTTAVATLNIVGMKAEYTTTIGD